MNDSLYEDYMRSVLGYGLTNYRNTYDMNYDNYVAFPNMTEISNSRNEELEKCYPDIYRIVYPMVQKACAQNNQPMTRELIDNLTDEVYFSIEDNEITQQSRGKEENRQRVVKNRTLNDLIRILILRELLGRPGSGFPGRPPHPIPPRPPMRPPMRPRPRSGWEDTSYRDYDIFEY